MNRTQWFVAALLGLALLAGCGERKRELPTDTDSAKKDADPPKKDNEPKDGPKKDGDAKDKKTDTPKHVPPKPLTPSEKPIELTSVKYGEAYAADSDTTTKKYEKKFLVLSGRVVKIGRSPGGEPLLELEGAKDALLGVQCFTRDRKPWLSALPGQTVKVQGVGPQVAGAASLDQCDVLSVGGGPPPTLQADELAKAYGSGVAATKKLFEGKPLILEGEVASVEAKEDEPVVVVLKTGAGPAAYLRFATDSAEGKRAAGFKPGQKVKGVGTFSVDAVASRASVGVSDVLVIDPAP